VDIEDSALRCSAPSGSSSGGCWAAVLATDFKPAITLDVVVARRYSIRDAAG